MRRSLGGHAYSAYNAIGGMIGDFAVITAGGGDNTVLAQQTSRYLLSSLNKLQKNKKLSNSVQYLAGIENIRGRKFDLETTAGRLAAMETLSLACVKNAAEKMMTCVSTGKKTEEAWNVNMHPLLDASKCHTLFYMMNTFAQYVNNVDNKDIKNVLTNLLDLSTFWFMERMASLFMEHEVLVPNDVSFIRQKVVDLSAKVRPQALPLVDAFAWPDWILKSPLGRYDGAIYSGYLNIVKSAPGCFGVPEYFEKHIQPLTRSSL